MNHPVSLAPAPSRAPWLEGLVLAGAVLLLLALGGEAVRVSYHGALHATVGDAVLTHGLQAENPYHAGAPLRYYLLYPQVDAFLGRVLGAPWWGFGALAVLAALLFPVALNALGASLGLSSSARRHSFWVALLGFNAWGWLGFVFSSTGFSGEGPPVFALAPLTFAEFSWHWDLRLQAFLVKFLNVSSFALALPFALWAVAGLLRVLRSAEAPGWGWFRVTIPAAMALAWNPLLGGVVGLAGVCLLPRLLSLQGWSSLLRAILAMALTLLPLWPWLAPLLLPAPEGGPRVAVNLGSQAGLDVLGPLGLLLPWALCGWRRLDSWARWAILGLALPALVLALWGDLPWGNAYNLVRWLGILLVPLVGLALAEPSQRRWRWFLWLFALPTWVLVPVAYLQWGAEAPPLPWVIAEGGLELRNGEQQSLIRAMQDTPTHSVLLVLPQAGGPGGTVQGHPWAPVCGRSLLVDGLHVHNEGQPDLHSRQEQAGAWFSAHEAPLATRSSVAAGALASLRSFLPTRPLLIAGPRSPLRASVAEQAGGSLLKQTGALALWLFPAQEDPSADGN